MNKPAGTITSKTGKRNYENILCLGHMVLIQLPGTQALLVQW